MSWEYSSNILKKKTDKIQQSTITSFDRQNREIKIVNIKLTLKLGAIRGNFKMTSPPKK